MKQSRINEITPVQVFSVAMILSAGAWIAGCAGGGGGSNEYKLSVNRLHSLNTSLLLYVNDYDDVLPLGSKWADGLVPYTPDQAVLHSPAVGTRGYGYAMNSAVAGTDLPIFGDPSTEVSLFDSTDLARNATVAISTEPYPPRYGSRNTIAYIDGHVQDYNTVNSVPIYTQSQQNLKQVALSTIMYSNDYDGNLPLAGQWMDELKPYSKSDAIFHSPAIVKRKPTAYGYALNSAIAGQLSFDLASPATTLMEFDSTVLTRNATASISTLPVPPRYGKDNTIAYADGHVH